MIAVDSSALVAVVLGEPERQLFRTCLLDAGQAVVSVVSVLEARMVVYGRRGIRGVVILDDLLRLPVFEINSPDREQMEAAYAAFLAYGKGSGHPACLNFGDVFSYALAKVRRIPLLFKGNDFGRTDIRAAISPN